MDIKDEVFEALREHISDQLVLNRDLADEQLSVQSLLELDQYASLQEGDCLKLYHPSNPHEALRVEIYKKEKSDTEILLYCSLAEWIFHIETELDDLLKEEEELFNAFF